MYPSGRFDLDMRKVVPRSLVRLFKTTRVQHETYTRGIRSTLKGRDPEKWIHDIVLSWCLVLVVVVIIVVVVIAVVVIAVVVDGDVNDYHEIEMTVVVVIINGDDDDSQKIVNDDGDDGDYDDVG